MANLIEARQGVRTQEEQKEAITPERFWLLLDKKPHPFEEIVSRFPQELPLLERYQVDLESFLSPPTTLLAYQEIEHSQKEIQALEETSALCLAGCHQTRRELTEDLGKTLEMEKSVQKEIEQEGIRARVILNRLRFNLHQRRGLPGRGLLEKLAAPFPFFRLPIHPLLEPILKERVRLEEAISALEAEERQLRKDQEEKIGPLTEAERQKQENFTQIFNHWVTENPQRLLAHLLQFPGEILPLRREFHRRWTDSKEFQNELEEGLQGFGLLEKVSAEAEAPAFAVQPSGRKTKEEKETENDWGFVFPNFDPERVVSAEEEIREALNNILEKGGYPESQIETLTKSLLMRLRDPLKDQMVRSVHGQRLRRQVGKFKFYLSGGWRATISIKGRTITIHELMSHPKWDKKQR